MQPTEHAAAKKTQLKPGVIDGFQKGKIDMTEFAHWIEGGESHIVRTDTIYLDKCRVYVFCPVHKEYVDITYDGT